MFTAQCTLYICTFSILAFRSRFYAAFMFQKSNRLPVCIFSSSLRISVQTKSKQSLIHISKIVCEIFSKFNIHTHIVMFDVTFTTCHIQGSITFQLLISCHENDFIPIYLYLHLCLGNFFTHLMGFMGSDVCSVPCSCCFSETTTNALHNIQ